MPPPYTGLPVAAWLDVTKKLVDEHPLDGDELVDVVLGTWGSIFDSSLGAGSFHIGKDIFPKPQIMGFLLHELIPLELARRYPGTWRGDASSADKDLVYVPDKKYSIELKTSSNSKHVFGNRSYAQESTTAKKTKSGYYLAVNFEKFSGTTLPGIVRIRFGWVDSGDWTGQSAATGQQSRLSPDVYEYKLIELYRKR